MGVTNKLLGPIRYLEEELGRYCGVISQTLKKYKLPIQPPPSLEAWQNGKSTHVSEIGMAALLG
jgi:hypothetical protein